MNRLWPLLFLLFGLMTGIAACGGSETTPSVSSGPPPGGGNGSGPRRGGGGDGSDTTPPQVVATEPPIGAVGVALTEPITATFSEPIRSASVGPSSFVVRDADGAAVSGTVTASGATAQFAPSPGALVNAATYQATLTNAIMDAAGNPLAADFTWSFTTIADLWQPVATAGAPTARVSHTAVWTGNQMIVWGGSNNLSFLATGGRYDPSQNAWLGVSTSGAPAARANHTAVWTGDQMIVWGGDLAGSLGVTNSGGRYTPSAGLGTWSTMPTAGAPAGRSQHTAVWTDTEMIVWGGIITGPFLTNTGGRFNPNGGGSWTATNPSGAPTARAGHTAVWTGSEMIIWGGTDGIGATNSGARYRPATNTWVATSTTNAPSARTHHTAIWTGTEMIVWGGIDGGNIARRDGARYNPATDTWTPLATTNAPAARGGHTAVWTGTEMIVWGGDIVSNQGGAYRPAGDTWRALATNNAPVARTGHTAIWTGSQMIVWGGAEAAGNAVATGGRYLP